MSDSRDFQFLPADKTAQSRLKALFENMNDDLLEGLPIYINVTNELIRTNAQNRLLHSAYYPAIANKRGDKPDEIEVDTIARCKRKFGLPILKRIAKEQTKRAKTVKRELYRFGLIDDDDETIKGAWQVIINLKFERSERKYLDAMSLMQCTRLMNTKEFSEYLLAIEIWAAEELGLALQSINETLRNQAMNL